MTSPGFLSHYCLEVICTLELISEWQKQPKVLYITPILSLATFINIYLQPAVWLFDIGRNATNSTSEFILKDGPINQSTIICLSIIHCNYDQSYTIFHLHLNEITFF